MWTRVRVASTYAIQAPYGSTYCQCLGQGLHLPLVSRFSIHSDSYITPITCNAGIIPWTVVFQEHTLKVFEGGRHLPLHFQSINPMCCVACHQGNGVLMSLDRGLFISGHISNTDCYIIPLKGGELRMGLLSLARKMLGLYQLGRNQNSSSSSHDHTCTALHTGLHKSNID